MEDQRSPTREPALKAFVALCAVLLGLYAFGAGGIFFFDDAPSMDGLLEVRDRTSALAYVFSGDAGPLGRPLALASFLPQQAAYAAGQAAPFLWVNIAVHLLNVVLLFALVLRLQRGVPHVLGTAPWLAPAVAFIWGVMPMLASASLMIVQRMTTLSAVFVLLGCHAYVWARQQAVQGRTLWTAVALAAVGLCTLLSALAKENGVLLPLLLLVMHYTLFGRNPVKAAGQPQPRATWQLRGVALCLWIPSAAVLAYIALRLPTIASTYANRPFTLGQRLATESVVLWEYLRVAFLPRFADLSPFRDDYPIREFSELGVQLAILAWVVTVAVGVWRWRKGHPLLLFAVFWYLVAHLLESTVFALFLYFEHRNYVPLMGLVIALVAWVSSWTALPLRVKAAVGLGYAVFLAFVLWQATSTWGSRQQLVWARQHPDSPRALQMLAGAYMQAGKAKDVEGMYLDALERNPKLSSVAIQGLRASCYLGDGGASTQQWFSRSLTTLPSGDFSHLTVSALQAVAHLVIQGQCVGLRPDDIVALADALESNAVYRVSDARAGLHAIRANLHLANRDLNEASTQLRKALQARPDIETVRLLHEIVGQTDGAIAANEVLKWAAALPPPGRGRFARQQWMDQVTAMASQPQ